MALTNNLKTQVDLPVWEWCRFAPAVSSATSMLTTARDGSHRYLYYMVGTQLYKYDTIGDAWAVLSVGPTLTTAVAAKYVKNQGYRGNVLSSTSNTIQIPSISTSMNGYRIRIVSGTGIGQERTITATGAEVVHDSGVATTVSGNAIADSLKKWKFNQWEGYNVKLVFNTGFSQFREILYNDTNNLTVFDANYEGRNFLMQAFSGAAPYATPVTTAGSQAMFNIVSQTITVDTPWDVVPDNTSKFMILSGGIWLTTVTSLFYYDILSDRWVQKLLPAGFLQGASAFSTDFAIAPTNELVGTYMSGSVTTAASQSITDSSLSLTKGEWIGSAVQIISGSGIGQERRIITNTSDTFVTERKWDVLPDSSSLYRVTAENAIFFVGNGRAQILKQHPEPSLWSTGNITDFGVPANMALIKSNRWQSHAVSSATRVTGGITAVNATPTAPGSGYAVGDLLTVSTGGTLGRVIVETVSITGAVLTVSLYTCGSGYTVGTGRATTGGAGSGCTIEITSIGTVGVITVPISHDFVLNDSFIFAGATEPAWNTTYNVLGIQSGTIIEVLITATANAVARYTQATALLVDCTKNWETNEHVGKLLGFQGNGLNGTIVWRRILGNSATTISFIAGTAPTNGNSRYFIQDLDAFGDDDQYLANNQLSFGFPTTASVSSITDSNKNWIPSAWINNKILFTSPSGMVSENIVTNNTATTLNIGRTVVVGSGTNTIAYNDFNGSGSYVGIGASVFTTSGNGIVWTGTRFVAVGDGNNTVAWSNDGITWNGLAFAIIASSGKGVATNGIRTVVVGQGSNTIAWAYDTTSAASYTLLGATIFSTQGNAVAWNGNMWLAAGQGTNTLAYALDTGSFSWTGLGTSTFSTAGRGLCWAGSQWVAVGSGTNTIATSTDGLTWTGLGTTTFTTQASAVAWNGYLTVAVGSGTNTIAYSTDSGSTWTGLGTSIFSSFGNTISWNGTYWVAGGQGTNTTAYSADGINWTGNGSTIITTAVNGSTSTTPFDSVVPSIGMIPDTNTRYKIFDTTGHATAGSTTSLTDATKRWKVNQWAGKRVLITSGLAAGFEYSITGNTATQLSFGAATAPDQTSTYTIIGRPAISTGVTVEWNFSSSLADTRGKYLISPRGGGSHTFDVYDIRTNKWNYGQFILGHGEGLTTGTMYAYDGDRIYYIANATSRVYYYDIVKNEIVPFATIPYGMSTAILSNRMEIIQTPDGLKYLYIIRHSSNEMWRMLIYY